MKRLLLIILLIFLSAGCKNSLPQPAVISGESSHAQTTIVFWNENAAADRTQYYKELIARFEKENPDIHVEYVGLPKKAARLKINTAIATNELPDVCGVQSAWIAEFYNKGVLLKLDNWFENWDGKDDIIGSVIAANRRLAPDGGLYQLPNTMGMEILWYRQDWFKQAGIEPPSDWDSFFIATEKLTDTAKGHYGYALRGGDGAAIQLLRAMFAYSGETQFFANDGHCVIRDPQYIAFVKRYLGMYRECTAISDITNGYQEMVAEFDSGQAAMMQHNLGSYGSHQRSLSEDQFKALLLPRSLKGTIVQEANNVDGYGIFYTTKHPEAAWRFVSFLCSPEIQSWWNERIGQMPVSHKALSDELVNNKEHMRLIRQALASDKMRFYMPPMYLPNYRKIVDETDTDIEQALMGNMAVEDLLAKWADKFEQANRDYQQKK